MSIVGPRPVVKKEVDMYYGKEVAQRVFTVKPGITGCLLYTSPSPRDRQKSRMPSSA